MVRWWIAPAQPLQDGTCMYLFEVCLSKVQPPYIQPYDFLERTVHCLDHVAVGPKMRVHLFLHHS
jgi:hypothetical protein